MGLFGKRTADLPAAKSAHARAKGELHRLPRNASEARFNKANRKVIEAEQRVRRAGGWIWS